MRLVVLLLVAAMGTFVLVGPGINVAQAYFGFQAPTPGQEPLITVTDTGPHHPAFEAVFFQLAEVGTEPFEVRIYISEVIDTTQQVESEEVAVEAFAQPVAEFGLHQPVLPLLVVVEGPSVETSGHIDSSPGRQARFHPEADRSCGIGKQVGLDRPILRGQGKAGKQHQQD